MKTTYTYLFAILWICIMQSELSAFSPSKDTTYFDYSWEECERSEAYYYRLFGKEDGKWVQKDYFFATDQLQNLGYYQSKKRKVRTGLWTYWYPSGQMIQKGAYENDRRVGIWTSWYPNGQLQLEYLYGKDIKIINFWLEGGEQILAEGEGEMMGFHENGETKYVGAVKDSMRSGTWQAFYPNGQLLEEVGYDDQGLASGTHRYLHPDGSLEWTGNRLAGKMDGLWMAFDPAGTLLLTRTFDAKKVSMANVPYTFGNRWPIPINMNQVKQSIGYPQKAINEGLEGYVIARILVDEHGTYLEHQIMDAEGEVFLVQVSKHLHELEFLPGIRDMERTSHWIRVPFNFAFNKDWIEGN